MNRTWLLGYPDMALGDQSQRAVGPTQPWKVTDPLRPIQTKNNKKPEPFLIRSPCGDARAQPLTLAMNAVLLWSSCLYFQSLVTHSVHWLIMFGANYSLVSSAFWAYPRAPLSPPHLKFPKFPKHSSIPILTILLDVGWVWEENAFIAHKTFLSSCCLLRNTGI